MPHYVPAESTLDPGTDLPGSHPHDALLDVVPASLRLGRGAGGVVWSGPDRHLPRSVAWKVASGEHEKLRLRHEARVLAALEHPAIVPIHDFAEGGDGSLRIALRLVRGQTLNALIAKAASVDERLRLLRPFLQAVDAIAWAHRLGWVHRDIKSTNIMIGEFGETQVIDWGLAVNLDDVPREPLGVVVGTLATMSPEQARGENATASFDIWSLGATLYEILFGGPLQPHPRELPGGVSELLAKIRTGARPRLDFARYGIAPELATIVERCLAPAPEGRYPDARGLATDLAAFLDGRLVTTHQYTARERAVRFIRHRRVPLAIVTSIAVTGAMAAGLAFARISEESALAHEARDAARAALTAREVLMAQSGELEAVAALDHDHRPEAERAAARVLAIRESPVARGVMMAFARAPRLERVSSSPAPLDCLDIDIAPDGRRALCTNNDMLALLDGARVLWTWEKPHLWARFIAGGERVALATADCDLATLDAQNGRLLHVGQFATCSGKVISEPHREALLVKSFAHLTIVREHAHEYVNACDGKKIMAAALTTTTAGLLIGTLCESGDVIVREPDGRSRKVATNLTREEAADFASAAMIGSGRIVLGATKGHLRLLDLTTGAELARTWLPGETVRHFQAGGDFVVVPGSSAGAAILSAETLAVVARAPRSERRFSTVEDDAGQPLVASFGTTLSSWRIPHGPVASLTGLAGVTSVTRDGAFLLVTHDDGATVFEAETGRRASAAAWTGFVAKAAILSGGHVVVGLHDNGPVQPTTATGPMPFSAIRARRLVALPGGRALSTGGTAGTALRTASGAVLEDAVEPTMAIPDLSATGDLAALLVEKQYAKGSMPVRTAVLYDLATAPLELGRCAAPIGQSVAVAHTGLAGDEPLLLVVNPSNVMTYRVEPYGQGTHDCTIVGHYTARGATFTRAVATPDGRYVAAGTREGFVHVWQENGTLLASVEAHASFISTLAYDPAGFVISGAWDGRVRYLDLAVLERSRTSLVHEVASAWGDAP